MDLYRVYLEDFLCYTIACDSVNRDERGSLELGIWSDELDDMEIIAEFTSWKCYVKESALVEIK